MLRFECERHGCPMRHDIINGIHAKQARVDSFQLQQVDGLAFQAIVITIIVVGTFTRFREKNFFRGAA